MIQVINIMSNKEIKQKINIILRDHCVRSTNPEQLDKDIYNLIRKIRADDAKETEERVKQVSRITKEREVFGCE